MPTLANSEEFLFWASSVATAILLVRFCLNGLASRYIWFVLFLVLALIRSIFTATVKLTPYAYGLVFMLSEALFWILFVLIILELYGMVLASYKGIQSFSQWAMLVSLAVSLLLATLSLFPDISTSSPAQFNLLPLFYIAERGIYSALLLLTVMMSAILLWYPIRLPRNVVFHAVIFAVYFLAKALAILLRNVTGQQLTRPVSLAILLTGFICLGLWMVLIRPAWETEEMVLGHRWDPDQEAPLVKQLQRINTALARITRE